MAASDLYIGNRAISFIGYGEAAQAFVSGWGASYAGAVRVYDIKTDSPDPQVVAAKQADYAGAGVSGVNELAGALDGARIIFSLVTADQASVAAANAAQCIDRDALFLDGNSCAPGTKRQSAELIGAAGGRYVDVAVMTPVQPALHKTPLLISGPHAEAALAALQQLDMVASEAPGEIGTASSIKMIRSIMIKGIEALVLETVLSARQAGVEDVVLASLGKTYPGINWTERAGYVMERVTTHGVRRAAEMREVAITVDELGLAGDMSRAAVEWQQRVGELAMLAKDAGDGEDYKTHADAILARLMAATR